MPTPPPINRVAALTGLSEDRIQVWIDAGLFERVGGRTEDWVARCHVLTELERANVPLRVLIAADRSDILERAYVLDFLQQRRHGEHNRSETLIETGLSEETLLRVCDALGFDDTTAFTSEELQFLSAIAKALAQGLPEAIVIETCELWGTQMRFIAAAEIVSYDSNLARRIMSEAESPLEGAAQIAPLTRSLLQAVDLLPMQLHHRHLLQALNLRTSIPDQPGGEALLPGEVDVAIAFIDLSGFTALTQEEGDVQALVYARRLELMVRRAARTGGPRIVKRLGDGLMLASPVALGMLSSVLNFVATVRDREDMPAARAAIAWGRAYAQAGDYFGHTVNLAARLLEQTKPSEVLVTDAMLDEVAGGPFSFSDPADLKLRGVREPVRVWRVEPVTEAED